MIIEQISVFLENKNGCLCEITRILSENEVNIRAIHIAETEHYGILRLIVDRPQDAVRLLQGNDFVVSTAPVLAVCVSDSVGQLTSVLELISKENIGIEYMYSVFGKIGSNAYMVFRVEQPERLIKLMEQNGIEVACKSELGIV